jgi:UDP:flavonoid glycosyltransferase YjiC (YdhE family)
MRFMMERMVMDDVKALYNDILSNYGLAPVEGSLFDVSYRSPDVVFCNGGYGSVLFSLSKGVPLLTAGIREGKNDINAHVDYFGVGIDLRTESPKPAAIRRAAERVLREPRWKHNAARLRDEFGRYHPYELIDAYLANGAAHST